MNFIKFLKSKINAVVLIALSGLLMSSSVYAESAYAISNLFSELEEGVDCISPKQFSEMTGNYGSGVYLPPCSGHLEAVDQTVTNFHWLLSKDEYLKHAEMFELKGNDSKRQAVVFQENIFDWGIGIEEFQNLIILLIILIGVGSSFQYMSKRDNGGIPKGLITIVLSTTLFVVFVSSYVRANVLLTIATLTNTIYLEYHDVDENLAMYKEGYLQSVVGAEKGKNNKRLVNALHQVIFERVIFERYTTNKYFGSDEKFRESGTFYRPELNLTGQEYLEMANECLSTFQMDIDMSSEYTLTNGLNFKSELPENHHIKSGGQTKNFYCNSEFFGKETTLAVIESNFPNVMSHIFQGNYKEDLGEEDSFWEKGGALIDVSLGEAEKVIKAAVVSGSNRNLQLDGLLTQSYAAVKTSNINRDNINSTKMFDKISDLIAKDLKEVLSFEEDFSVDERLNLSNLAIEAYKMALIGGYDHGEDEFTEELKTGFQPIERFIKDTVMLNIEFHSSKSSTPEAYVLRKKYADEFNSNDLSSKNRRYSLTKGFDLDGFSFNYSTVDVGSNKGKRFALKAIGDPSETNAIYKDMADRKLAFETLLNAVDVAGYKWAMQNAQEMDETLIIEMLNGIRMDFASVVSFKNKQIEKQAGIEQVANAEMDLYEIKARYWNPAEKQTYFPYELVGIDTNDEEAIELFDQQNALKQYDASMLLTDAFSPKAHGVVSERSYADMLGVNDLIADLFTMGDCRVKDANGRCRMSATQLAFSNTSYMYKAAAFSGGTIVITEFASSICKFKGAGKVSAKAKGFGTGKAMDKAAALSGSCDIVDGFKSLITTPLGFAFALSVIMIILGTIASSIGLVVGFISVVYPLKSFVLLVPMLIYTLVIETFQIALYMTFNGFDANEMKWSKTSGIFKEILFQLAYYPLMLLFLLYALTTPTIAGALFDMTNNALSPNEFNPFSVMFSGFVLQAVNLIYVWFIMTMALTKVEGSAREVLGVQTNFLTTDTGDMSFAKAYLITNGLDRVSNAVGDTKDNIFGKTEKSGMKSVQEGIRKMNRPRSNSESEKTKEK